jgi:short-subunit dehydrogenase
MAKPVTLITGASAGIGVALARKFAGQGHELVLVARRQAQLDSLADEIAATGRPRPTVLPADLTQSGISDRLDAALQARGLEPQYVVNNAGFGLVGAAAGLDRDEQLSMIDLNIRALTELSLAWIPSLERHHGGILNVASLAGLLPGPGMAVYYASKAYVVSFSEALHAELRGRGVRVTALCPGPVPSEFQSRAGVKQESYPPVLTQSAEHVAEAGYAGLMQGRRMVVPGFGPKLVPGVLRLLPRSFVLALSGARELRRVKSRRPGL